jgi:purine-nucleoside phosphorylase
MANKESISASIVQKADIAKVVLMPGDPLRAKALADRYLTDAVVFNDTRNMLGYTGSYQGKRISVMGHGMGVPSIGIYTQELFTQFGVEAVIRIGSAGGLSMDVDAKDVVIAMAASTNSNYGNAYGIPGQLAACADYDMLAAAVAAAQAKDIKVRVGKVYTSDFFYYPQPGLATSAIWRSRWRRPVCTGRPARTTKKRCPSCRSRTTCSNRRRCRPKTGRTASPI